MAWVCELGHWVSSTSDFGWLDPSLVSRGAFGWTCRPGKAFRLMYGVVSNPVLWTSATGPQQIFNNILVHLGIIQIYVRIKLSLWASLVRLTKQVVEVHCIQRNIVTQYKATTFLLHYGQ